MNQTNSPKALRVLAFHANALAGLTLLEAQQAREEEAELALDAREGGEAALAAVQGTGGRWQPGPRERQRLLRAALYYEAVLDEVRQRFFSSPCCSLFAHSPDGSVG